MSPVLAIRQSDAEDLHHRIIFSAAIGMTIAGCTTLLRLGLRIRRLWWDDALALGGLAFLLVTAIAGKLYYSLNEESETPQGSRVALYYIFSVTFDLTIWTSRLSILFSVIRLGSYHRRLYTAAVLFTTAMLILVAQVFWVCEPQARRTSWKEQLVPLCVLGRSVAIAQVTTDIFADCVLIVFPLLILRSLRSAEAKAQRVRLSTSFAVGGLTTIVSIVHAVYLLQNTQVSILVSNAELSVSVIICNFAVLAAAVHRLWNKYHPAKEDPRLATINFEPPPRRVNSQGETIETGMSPEVSAISGEVFEAPNMGTIDSEKDLEQHNLKEKDRKKAQGSVSAGTRLE